MCMSTPTHAKLLLLRLTQESRTKREAFYESPAWSWFSFSPPTILRPSSVVANAYLLFALLVESITLPDLQFKIAHLKQRADKTPSQAAFRRHVGMKEHLIHGLPPRSWRRSPPRSPPRKSYLRSSGWKALERISSCRSGARIPLARIEVSEHCMNPKVMWFSAKILANIAFGSHSGESAKGPRSTLPD